MVNLWNHTMFPDEEDELSDRQKREGHIILGRRSDKSIRSMKFRGALTDFLEWAGGEDYIADIKDVAKGEATIWDKIKEAPKGTAVKGISALRPESKLLYETLTGMKLYPDPFNSRPIRDKTEHVLKSVSMDQIYRKITGKPMRGLSEELQSLVFYSTDPGEASYWDIKSKTYEFLEKKGKEVPSGKPSKKANYIYYYKQALRYGDAKAAKKWYAKYFEEGGTLKGMQESIKYSSPLGSLPEKLKQEFMDSLDKQYKDRYKTAQEWYESKKEGTGAIEEEYRKSLKKPEQTKREKESQSILGRNFVAISEIKDDDFKATSKIETLVSQIKNNPDFGGKFTDAEIEKQFTRGYNREYMKPIKSKMNERWKFSGSEWFDTKEEAMAWKENNLGRIPSTKSYTERLEKLKKLLKK